MVLQKMDIQSKKPKKQKSEMRKRNNKSILIAILFFLSISCAFQQICNDNDCIFIGEITINSEQYKVFNCFKKIKTATSYKGNSKLRFTSSKKSFEYNLDEKEDLIDSIVGNKFYNNSEFTVIDSLSSTICLPTGCFEIER